MNCVLDHQVAREQLVEVLIWLTLPHAELPDTMPASLEVALAWVRLAVAAIAVPSPSDGNNTGFLNRGSQVRVLPGAFLRSVFRAAAD